VQHLDVLRYGLLECDRLRPQHALDAKVSGRAEVVDKVTSLAMVGDLGVRADHVADLVLVVAVNMLRVDDRDDGARGEDIAEPHQRDGTVHPMEARATGDEPVRALELSVLDPRTDPMDARIGAGRDASTHCDHLGRGVDGVHPLDRGRKPPRDRPRAGSGIQHDPGSSDEPTEDLEDLTRVRRAEPVELGDLSVSEDVGERHAGAR
jgi:hypothetical protein